MATASHKGNKSERKPAKVKRYSHRFSSDELLLQPWFLPGKIAFAIRSLAPPDYHLKMRYFFDDYGCMVCRRDHDYGSNGMCHNCMTKIRKKLTRSVRLRLKRPEQRRFDLGLVRQAKLANKLLKSFAEKPNASQRSRIRVLRPMNPVDEALGPDSLRGRLPR